MVVPFDFGRKTPRAGGSANVALAHEMAGRNAV
jgi:hypothetical protein